MEFAYIFWVGCSLAVLFAIFFQTRKNSSIAGSRPFLWQIILVTIWAVGSMFELLSPTEQGMMFCRNIEQIGVFLLPVTCVYFSVDFARYDRLKKYLPLLLIIPIVALVLIFTDSTTHIMRYGYIVSYSPLFGKALSVQSTFIGKAFVANNFAVALASLVILYFFSRQIAKNMRRQVIFILLAMGLIMILGLLKTAFLEGSRINIPIVTLYLPGSLILYFNLSKNNFFYVSPIARNTVFDVIEMGIVVTDSSGMIVDKNPSAVNLLSSFFGVREEIAGKKMDDVFREYPNWVDLVHNTSAGEIEIEKNDNNSHFIHIRVHPLLSKKGLPVGSVTIIRDITAFRLQEFALKLKAEIDSLTGLLNRNGLMDTFVMMLRESSITGKVVSVLMMDLDKFKGINDTFGHSSGDKVIMAFADLLKAVLRQEDAIGRIGGDEFVAILPNVSETEAILIANRISRIAEEQVIYLEGGTSIQYSVSIGICDNKVLKSEDEILKRADKAMYMTKKKQIVV